MTTNAESLITDKKIMELVGNILIYTLIALITWGLVFLGLSFYLLKKNRAQIKGLYHSKLTFAPINFTQAPRMNRNFFDENTSFFMQLDFTPIGDFTIPQLPPENYNRALYHSPYHTYALMSQMRVKGLLSYITKNLPPWFELITVFEDGSFLTTECIAAAGATMHPPEDIYQKAAWNSPPEVFTQHLKTLNDLVSQGKKTLPVSLEGFFAAVQERFRREGEFRQKHGYLTPAEVKAISQGSGKNTGERVTAWVVGKIDRQ